MKKKSMFSMRHMKKQLITIFPVCLNSMNYTGYFCHYSGNTGNIFTTGATLVPSMEHRRTASGAAAASHWRITMQEKC